MSGYDYAFFRKIVGGRGGGARRGGRSVGGEPSTSGEVAPDAFVCPRCGDGSAFATECARCHVPVESVSGDRPPTLASRVPAFSRRPPFGWKGIIFLSAALVGSGGLYWLGGEYPGEAARPGGGVLVLIGLALLLVNPAVKGIHGWIERLRIGRMVRRVTRKLLEVEPVPIAELAEDDPIQRIRGRVRVVEPAPGGDPDVAATLSDGLDRRCGRFEVVDDTGTALVADRHLELWDDVDPTSPVTIRDGDEVDVVGPSVRRIASDVKGSGGYRGGAESFVFEHRDGVPVHVLHVRSGGGRLVRVAPEPPEEEEVVEEPVAATRRDVAGEHPTPPTD